uniref:(northern house mosquito) hypothetical protein n=1 Tax=Culex pipiens TaxID=7175 RepID=A0A8D8BAL9_CULPI
MRSRDRKSARCCFRRITTTLRRMWKLRRILRRSTRRSDGVRRVTRRLVRRTRGRLRRRRPMARAREANWERLGKVLMGRKVKRLLRRRIHPRRRPMTGRRRSKGREFLLINITNKSSFFLMFFAYIV